MTLSLGSIVLGAFIAFALIWLLGRLVGFRSQKPEHYEGQGTQFDIREVLKGDIICEGVVYGPLGRVTSRFVADMNAQWDGTKGHMTEAFRYDNGNTQDREWTLVMTSNDGSFDATAPDLIGTGKGQQMGSGVKLEYKIQLPESAGGHVLSAVDWMYLMENGTIINRSQLRKFGIKVAELVATMRPAT